MENEIKAYSLETALTCEEAKQIFLDGSYSSYDQMIEVTAKVEKCKLEEYNARNPADPVVETMSVDTSNDNPKILFNTIRLKDAEKVADVAKVFISIGAAVEFDGNPQMITIVSALGNLQVDAYLDAAQRNDPLIIFLPQAVPALKVGKDVFKTITDGKIVDKVEIVFQDGMDFIKQNPTTWLAGTSAPIIDAIKKVVPQKIVANVDKAAGTVVELTKDGVKLVLSPVKSVAEAAPGVVKKAVEAPVTVVKEVGKKIKKIFK